MGEGFFHDFADAGVCVDEVKHAVFLGKDAGVAGKKVLTENADRARLGFRVVRRLPSDMFEERMMVWRSFVSDLVSDRQFQVYVNLDQQAGTVYALTITSLMKPTNAKPISGRSDDISAVMKRRGIGDKRLVRVHRVLLAC